MPAEIVDQPRNGRLMLKAGGRLIGMYHYHPFLLKPYFYPLIGPTGKNVTQDVPADHIHHRSVWFGHQNVNGVDFYLESGDEGRIVHRCFHDLVIAGERSAITADHDWVAPEGNPVLADTLRIALTDLGAGAYYLDFGLELRAEYGPVTLTDTKEAGLPLVRVADAMDEIDGGRITAAGGRAGEKETFGQPSPWIDYSGPAGEPNRRGAAWQGIAMFDHPQNEGHPPPAFTRSYGPMSTREGFFLRGERRLAAKGRLALYTRLFVHGGDAEAAAVAAHFQRYAAESPGS